MTAENGRMVALKLSPVDSEGERFIILARDISESAAWTRQPEGKEKLLASLISEASTPVFVVQDGIIRFASKAAYEFFGYQPEEITGTAIDSYLTEDQKDEIMNLYHQRLINRPVRKKIETRIRHRDGHSVDVAVELNLVFHDGNYFEIVIMHDISELKKIQTLRQVALEKTRAAFEATINILNKLVAAKDPYTVSHQKRVADLAVSIATEMGLEPEQIDGLRLASQIHDIGKIIVPSEILSKPGIIIPSEMALIRNHVQFAYELLKDIEFHYPVAEIVYQHHERLDGSGYPRALRGDEIILEAKILAVADVVEAMVSHRPYRVAYSLEETLNELERNKGILYDEKVVEVSIKLFREKNYNFVFSRQ
ncbi:MAG: HD domain-containing phosphohydrolase [Candidatus Saccharicenans sp.]